MPLFFKAHNGIYTDASKQFIMHASIAGCFRIDCEDESLCYITSLVIDINFMYVHVLPSIP